MSTLWPRRNCAWLPLAMATVTMLSAVNVGRAHAQAVSIANVTGRVEDAEGAVIPNAQVTLTQVETGAVHTVQSNGDGLYTEPNLPVGPYKLTVTAGGFQTYVQNGIVLQVNDNIQINAQMKIGEASETVQVDAQASSVQVQSSNPSQVIDRERIVELPLNGRDPTQLITLSGAAVNHSDGTNTGTKSFATSNSIAIAGGGGNQTNYLLDGGDNNDSYTNVNLPFPFPDALQEFSVETSALPARNGLHPGGLVNVVTKSGTNQFHGTAFEFVRNYAVNANNYFAASQDSLKRNQFGGVIGGPIIKNKLFFFGGYQNGRIRQNPLLSVSYVPTAAAISGDFTALESAACNASGARQVKDPVTGTIYRAGSTVKINPAEFDPAAVKLLSYLPTSQADQCGKVSTGSPVNSNETQYVTREDWTVSNNHTLYGRYFFDQYDQPAYFSNTNILVVNTPAQAERVQSAVIGDVYSFTPSLTNSFHVSASRRRINRGPNPNQGINAATLGVQNVYQGTPNYLQLSMTNGGFNVGSSIGALGVFNVNSFQEADDVDWVKGNHQLAFGVDVIRTQDNVFSHYEDNGNFQFNGASSGDVLLDFLTGYMYKYEQTMPQTIAFRQTLVGVYAQDTWRATPKLVINAGLRWEPTLWPQDYFGRGAVFSQTNFNSGTHSTVFPNAPAGYLFNGDAGIPRGFANDKLFNFSPRLGIVYNPDGEGKTTFRAGGAMMYDSLGTYLTYRITANNLPYGLTTSNVSGPYQFSNPWTPNRAGFTAPAGGNPFPIPFNVPKNFSAFPQGGSLVTIPQDSKPVTMIQYNAGMQHQFGLGYVFSLNYLGNRSYHQLLGNELNPGVYIPGTWTGPGSCGPLTVSPGLGKPCSSTANTQARRVLSLQNPAIGQYYGTLSVASYSGFSNYNGLLASLEHRFKNGYTLLANYTWSKCMQIQPIISIGVEGVLQNPNNPRGDYGPCTFDATNIANISAVARSTWHGNKLASAILSDWQLAPLLRYTSGLPFTPTTGTDNSLTGINLDRPNPTGVMPYVNNPTRTRTGGYQYINKSAFTPNPTGTFGVVGRDSLRGPRYVDVDASVSRIFKLYERLDLQARVDVFNVLNHPNFANPSSNAFSSSTFGKITTTINSDAQREMQGAVKFIF